MTPAPNRVDELKKRYEENPRRFFAPLANEYRKAGDLAAAIDLCQMHLEEQPGHLSGHIVYGQALFESARPAEAKTIFEAALTLDPENLIALRHLGDIARGEGDAAVARQWYGRVLEADPRNDEVTALIESLGQLAAAPTVVIEPPHEPPPPPDYSEHKEAPVAAVVDAQAPTPIVPAAAVPPAPTPPSAPRLSIGLMDLDLNLADSTAASVDLLGIGAPMAAAPPAVETPAPDVLEAAPTMDEGFALSAADEVGFPDVASTIPGEDAVSLGASAPAEGAIEVHDTSFEAPPIDEAPMFAVAEATPSFGDSLDVTASSGVGEAEPPRLSLLDGIPMIDTGDSVPIGEPITEPTPIAAPGAELIAAPSAAPATPADFDALFGNAPIADVTIGGDAAVPVGEAGFTADSFVGREPTDEVLETAPDIGTPPSPFVTETMAELYLQQGFREEALGVYRQLLAQNPDDKGLAERVRHLEHGTRSSLAIDSESEQIEAAVEAEELRLTGSIPAVPEAPAAGTLDTAPIVEGPSGPMPIIEMVPEPAAAMAAPPPAPLPAPPLAPSEPAEVSEPEPVMEMLVEAPALAAPAPAEPAPAAPTPAAPAPMPAPTGPKVRDLFARIAARRAVPGGGFAPPPEPEAPAPAAADALGAAQDATTPAAAVATMTETTIAPGGSVDRVFAMSGVVATDEGAALAMAAAYGGAPTAPIRGEPTRRVTDELSLDSVFKDEGGERAAGVQRQSSRLRFDQFFSGTEGGAAPPTPPPSSAPPAPADDIAQFTDWLKGLKGS